MTISIQRTYQRDPVDSNSGQRFGSRRQGSGTYTVNSDCSGALTYTDSVNHSTSNYDIYINGNNVQFVSTDNGTISAGTFSRQFLGLPR